MFIATGSAKRRLCIVQFLLTVLLIFASQLSRVAAGSTASAVQEVFVVCGGGGSIVPSHPAQCVQWANKV